jgi:hypothetical protein
MNEKTSTPKARALIHIEAGVLGLKTGGVAFFTPQT